APGRARSTRGCAAPPQDVTSTGRVVRARRARSRSDACDNVAIAASRSRSDVRMERTPSKFDARRAPHSERLERARQSRDAPRGLRKRSLKRASFKARHAACRSILATEEHVCEGREGLRARTLCSPPPGLWTVTPCGAAA